MYNMKLYKGRKDEIVLQDEEFKNVEDEMLVSEISFDSKEKEWMNKQFEATVLLHRGVGMKNALMLISGNAPSVMTMTTEYLEKLISEDVIDEDGLDLIYHLVKTSLKRGK